MPVSRQARAARRTAIARTLLAIALVVVVLAGALPPGSFASSHECGMACCVGKSAHTAGSCSTSLGDDETPAEAPDEAGDEHAAHGHSAHGARDDSAAHDPNHHESRRAASFTSAAWTKPCSPECAAAAFVSSQLRRPRHAAWVVFKAQPRPLAARSFFGRSTRPAPKSADYTRRAQPRAPPAALINLSA